MTRFVALLFALFACCALVSAAPRRPDPDAGWFTPSEIAPSTVYQLRSMLNRWSGRARAEAQNDRPDFCREYECPEFEEHNKTGYSLRTYEKASWVSTEVQDVKDMKSAQHIAFRRLFKYIQGYNLDQESIKMTVPVTFNVTFKDVHGVMIKDDRVRFIGSFYLPGKYQENEDIPVPRDRLVYTHEHPKFTAAVKSFGGHADEESVHKIARELKAALDKDGVEYCPSNAILAVYNEPWVTSGRHNEIW